MIRWDSRKPTTGAGPVARIVRVEIVRATAPRRGTHEDLLRECAEAGPAYRRSGYALSRDILDVAPEEWTQARLDARQRRLAARAAHIWPADFA